LKSEQVTKVNKGYCRQARTSGGMRRVAGAAFAAGRAAAMERGGIAKLWERLLKLDHQLDRGNMPLTQKPF